MVAALRFVAARIHRYMGVNVWRHISSNCADKTPQLLNVIQAVKQKHAGNRGSQRVLVRKL